jgi:hypothetical protein
MVASPEKSRKGEFLHQQLLKTNEKVLLNARGCSSHEHRLWRTLVGWHRGRAFQACNLDANMGQIIYTEGSESGNAPDPDIPSLVAKIV